jgi:hypothetical protein
MEVFKRDSFTCQYCGRKPPEVILECDHIVAVAKGGGDDMLNLTTACFDCNRGKRDRSLGDLNEGHLQNNEAERLIQQVALNELLINLRKKKQKQYKVLKQEVEFALGFGIVNKDDLSLRMFFDKIDYDSIIANANSAGSFGRSFDHKWKLFCSFCWKKLKGEQDD